MKKLVLSLLVVAVVVAMAPQAMAQCYKCKVSNHTCPVVTSGGFDLCYWLGVDCIIGEFCGVAAMQPLASEYEVASVERADEPQPRANETRMALLEPKTGPEPEAQRAPAAHR